MHPIFLYVQIGDDALRGRTNPVRIPYWADSVTVLRWQQRKLSGIVSDKQIQVSHVMRSQREGSQLTRPLLW